MAITIDDFNKIWASTSPLTPYNFSESNYKEGWNFIGGTPPARQMWDAWLKMTDEKCQYLYNHEDVPVGHEYFTFNPNIPQGSLPLFGGEYSRETYSALWNWVQEQTGYLKTEAEWQTLATANNGNVPYYSDGDGSTTFRVPALNCWMRSANGTVSEVGSYLQAGLPNITGQYCLDSGTSSLMNIGMTSVGAFTRKPTLSSGEYGVMYRSFNVADDLAFDASLSNSIYGNSTTVQPASVVGMWLVKAYGTVADTGVINEQQYIDDRLGTKLSLTGGTMIGAIKGNNLTLTAENGGNSASLVLGADGSAQWDGNEIERVVATANTGVRYIRFDSGLQMVFGDVNATQSGTTVNFPAPFDGTNYFVLATAGGYTITAGHTSATSTSIKITSSASGGASVDFLVVGWWK